MNERCFALKRVTTRTGDCVCCEGGCPGYAACPFYKPMWKFERELERKYAKLSALPESKQLYIAQKYYKGLMPWRRDFI